MRHYERNKRALYWTAVSLIICEGLPIEEAAHRMGIQLDELIDILKRRRTIRLDGQSPPDRSPSAAMGRSPSAAVTGVMERPSAGALERPAERGERVLLH